MLRYNYKPISSINPMTYGHRQTYISEDMVALIVKPTIYLFLMFD
jgi:hypothetical protein